MHGDKPGSLGSSKIGELQPKHRRGPGEHRYVAAIDGRCQGEDIADARRERPQAMQIDAGNARPRSERHIRWQAGKALAFRAKLKERERVAASLTVQAVRKLLAKRLTRLVAQQLPRRRAVQAMHLQGRQVGAVEQRRLSLSHCQDDCDRIGQEAAKSEEHGGCA